jgi:predicted amidophosphoribosyltransferase
MFVSHLLSYVFPPVCVHCHREGSWICDEGRRALRAAPILINPIHLDGVAAIYCRGTYDLDVLGSYIRSLKYAGWSALREALPELLEPVLTHLPPEAAIIPLPLHPRRQRERGFNQAQLIAECLAELRQQEILPALRRIRATKQQATLDEVGRQKNMLGAFAIAKKLQSVIPLTDKQLGL